MAELSLEQALAGVRWLRDNPERWNQGWFLSPEGQVCWAGAVLVSQGYGIKKYEGSWYAPHCVFLDRDGRVSSALELLGVVGMDVDDDATAGEIIGWIPEDDRHDAAALDELEKLVREKFAA